ncbi:MAG: DUF1295 domain-containing protein, partial [Gammaproteobacteria bacterium]
VMNTLLWGWLGAALLMLLLWAVQWRTRNAGIVDVAWALGTGVLGVLFALDADGDATRGLLLAVMIGFWGIRLGLHLGKRVSSESEDGRYRYMREHLGDRVQPAMFVFFQVQAVWALMFALPVWAAAAAQRAPDLLDAIGLAVFVIAIGGESIADAQLAAFRQDPANKGRVCDRGLWRYSRHPNYFFEWLHWFAYPLIAWGASWWWITVVAIPVMLVFLLKVTGVPWTEQQSLRSRGDAYRRYQQRTSVFIPLPPGSPSTEGSNP